MSKVNSKICSRIILLLWMALVFSGGCHYENVGGTKKSPEVAQAFKALYVYPSYRYYFLNQENDPYGVAGLESAYWIDDPAWREVDPQSEVFKKVVGLVQSFTVPGSYTEGYTIHDPQGMQIGVWYSSLGAGVTVDPNTKRVSITTATPWLSK
jgi:hypothetical protein